MLVSDSLEFDDVVEPFEPVVDPPSEPVFDFVGESVQKESIFRGKKPHYCDVSCEEFGFGALRQR